jgi:hypothetical protein
MSLIDRVGRGEDSKLLTRSLGLRQRVEELKKMQQLRDSLENDPKVKLKKTLNDINLNLDVYKSELRNSLSSNEKSVIENKIKNLEQRKREVESQLNSNN